MLVLKTSSNTESVSAPNACPSRIVPSSNTKVADFIVVPLTPAQLIVRGFLRHNHIMWMAFDQAGIGDAREARFGTEVFQGGRTRIPHARAQTPDQLIHIFAETALIRHAPFDAFRDELAAAVLPCGITIDTVA